MYLVLYYNTVISDSLDIKFNMPFTLHPDGCKPISAIK